MSPSDLYRDIVLDHWRNPRLFKLIKSPTHEHSFANASCGDGVSVQLQVDQGIIVDASFQVNGCALSTASASVLAESIVGSHVSQLTKMTEEDIRKMLGDIEPIEARTNCLTLGLQAAQQLVADIH